MYLFTSHLLLLLLYKARVRKQNLNETKSKQNKNQNVKNACISLPHENDICMYYYYLYNSKCITELLCQGTTSKAKSIYTHIYMYIPILFNYILVLVSHTYDTRLPTV